jgi:hypothetical protein
MTGPGTSPRNPRNRLEFLRYALTGEKSLTGNELIERIPEVQQFARVHGGRPCRAASARWRRCDIYSGYDSIRLRVGRACPSGSVRRIADGAQREGVGCRDRGVAFTKLSMWLWYQESRARRAAVGMDRTIEN